MAKTWKSPVREVYESLAELKAYDELHKIALSCGYTDCESLWRDNPTIGGSVNPEDFGVVLSKFTLSGTYRKAHAIGKPESFTITVKSTCPRKAMYDLRSNAYECGFKHVLFTNCKKGKTEIPMLTALGLE